MEQNYHDCRCPSCNKLFFKKNAQESIVEIKCKNCKNIHQVDVSNQKVLTVNDEQASYKKDK